MLNLSKFNFQFFLSGVKEVLSLEGGARAYGGATKLNGKIYSNVPNGDFVEVGEDNTISVYVPSTMNVNVDATIDKRTEVLRSATRVMSRMGKELSITDTKGSWYSEDLDKVIVEDITIVSVKADKVDDYTIVQLQNLANFIKLAMQQEGVSININGALAIV